MTAYINSLTMRAVRVPINWHSGLSIYASECFLKSVGDEYGWIGGIESSGKLCCVLPYFVIKKSIFRFIRFTSETIVIDGEMSIEEEESFLNRVIEYFRSTGADLIIPGAFTSLFRTYPNGSVAAPYGSYIVDLRGSEVILWNNVHPKHRNVIRNARKKGVVIQQGSDYLDTACRLVADSFRRSSIGYFNKLRLCLKSKDSTIKREIEELGDNAKIFVAQCGAIIQGCAVIHFSQYCAYYMHGGSIDKPITGAMNLLQWEAMLSFKKLGVNYFNFVGARINPEPGSKQEGLSMFKRRFGGKLKQGYMWKYSFNKLKARLYSCAVKVRNGGDIVDIERHKLRNT